MAKKQIPLIGRIHEKIAAGGGTDRGKETAPGLGQQGPAVRVQADWLLDRIRRTGAQFLSLARHGGFASKTDDPGDGDERRRHALLLAYKLTLTAWRGRETAAEREVLRVVRNRMLRELRDAEGQDADPDASRELQHTGRNRDPEEPLSQRFRPSVLDPADADIKASLIRFEAGLPGPLTPFYGDLAPTFGGPCPSDGLSKRYGKIVRHLYETVEQKLDERERAGAAAKRITRYAGAGQ